jgi:hypothetical protein
MKVSSGSIIGTQIIVLNVALLFYDKKLGRSWCLHSMNVGTKHTTNFLKNSKSIRRTRHSPNNLEL